ncbi:MAG TPA: alpha-ketoglutarate-dependent dioxygenase AlkB [Allosphingosinicella sp.]|nr:alpha-ketoglutarate-dependent dioxygenase AlkB [Allosphingosinicella sp.]
MPRPKLNLFADPPPPAPAGLVYEPGFVGAEEERALAGSIAALPFKPFEFHGFTGKRRTVSFGLHYAFDGSGLREAEPIPSWLQPLRERAAALAGREPGDFVHALVIEYAPGAGIGWHRDRPVFGDVVGISLLAPAPLRFRRRSGTGWQRFTLTAEPRSAYLLRGEARHEWEHSIPQLETLRYSVTLRTLAK